MRGDYLRGVSAVVFTYDFSALGKAWHEGIAIVDTLPEVYLCMIVSSRCMCFLGIIFDCLIVAPLDTLEALSDIVQVLRDSDTNMNMIPFFAIGLKADLAHCSCGTLLSLSPLSANDRHRNNSSASSSSQEDGWVAGDKTSSKRKRRQRITSFLNKEELDKKEEVTDSIEEEANPTGEILPENSVEKKAATSTLPPSKESSLSDTGSGNDAIHQPPESNDSTFLHPSSRQRRSSSSESSLTKSPELERLRGISSESDSSSSSSSLSSPSPSLRLAKDSKRYSLEGSAGCRKFPPPPPPPLPPSLFPLSTPAHLVATTMAGPVLMVFADYGKAYEAVEAFATKHNISIAFSSAVSAKFPSEEVNDDASGCITSTDDLCYDRWMLTGSLNRRYTAFFTYCRGTSHAFTGVTASSHDITYVFIKDMIKSSEKPQEQFIFCDLLRVGHHTFREDSSMYSADCISINRLTARLNWNTFEESKRKRSVSQGIRKGVLTQDSSIQLLCDHLFFSRKERSAILIS